MLPIARNVAHRTSQPAADLRVASADGESAQRQAVVASGSTQAGPSRVPLDTDQRNRNSDHLDSYIVAVEQAARRDAGDGGKVISAAVAEDRGVAASGFIQWMSINEHSLGELPPAERKQRMDEYVQTRESQRKRKREGADTGNTSTSRVLANEIGKYFDWLDSGTVQKQRGVLTSQVEGSGDALASNKGFLQDYRAALKSAQSTPTAVIDKVISAKTAQNRAGSASRLITHLSEKGLDARVIIPQALQREVDEISRGIAVKATAEKFKSEAGKFLDWRSHRLQAAAGAAPAELSEEQVACLESNAEQLRDYRSALQDAATPAPGRAAGVIGEVPRKNRGVTAAAFVSWIKGKHELAWIDEDEWHGLKHDYLQFRFSLAEGVKPHSSWRSEESNLNKYIEWAMTGVVSSQKGGKAAPPTDQWGQANTLRLSNYRNALATAARTPAGDGNFMISGFVQQNRGSAARHFLEWLSARQTDAITLDRPALGEAMSEFLFSRYPDPAEHAQTNRDKLASDLRPFLEWQADKTVKVQQGVDVVRDHETQRTLDQNNFWLSRYQDSLTETPAEGAQPLSASALKNRKVQSKAFTKYCSFEGRVLTNLTSGEVRPLSEAYVADKFPETRASVRHSLRPYLDWLSARQGARRASRESSPGLFVSDNE